MNNSEPPDIPATVTTRVPVSHPRARVSRLRIAVYAAALLSLALFAAMTARVLDQQKLWPEIKAADGQFFRLAPALSPRQRLINWLRNFGFPSTGGEYHISLSGDRIDDAWMKRQHNRLARLASVDLALYDCSLSSEGWRFLSRVSSMHTLSISATPLSQKGFMYLSRTKLNVLNISGADIPIGALPHISSFSHLKHLQLHATQFSPQVAAAVAQLSNLETLWLDRPPSRVIEGLLLLRPGTRIVLVDPPVEDFDVSALVTGSAQLLGRRLEVTIVSFSLDAESTRKLKAAGFKVQ